MLLHNRGLPGGHLSEQYKSHERFPLLWTCWMMCPCFVFSIIPSAGRFVVTPCNGWVRIALTSFQGLTWVSPQCPACGMGHLGLAQGAWRHHKRASVMVRLALAKGSPKWAPRCLHEEANRTHPKIISKEVGVVLKEKRWLPSLFEFEGPTSVHHVADWKTSVALSECSIQCFCSCLDHCRSG